MGTNTRTKNPLDQEEPHVETPQENHSEPVENLWGDDEFFIRTTLMQNHQLGTELLFNRYYSVLCAHAVRYVGSKAVAEDLVSDIFYKFYSKRIFERITTSYRAYFFRTVRNSGYNYLKWEASRKTRMEDEFEWSGSEGQQPDHITHYEELYQSLEKIVNDLPVQRRNIYMQFQFEGKSHKDIASELGISTRTVEVQVYRATQTIRSLIAKKWFLPALLMLELF